MSNYYTGLTTFVNDNSGLDPLSIGHVQAIIKAAKKFKVSKVDEPHGRADRPHGRANLMIDFQSGNTQCTARSKQTGQRCRQPAALGGNVCRIHGGAAPQTRAKAQRRLQQAADVLVQRLLSFALDDNVSDNVAIVAIRDALDRAGLKPGIDVSVTAKLFESIFDHVETGTRSDYRRSQGIEDTTDEQPALDAPIEVEVLEDWLEPNEPDDNENGSVFAPVAPPPSTALMPLDEAVSTAARFRHAHRV
jgi:hypothetical protein